MEKLECIHADTCLPDYWTGHHLPHMSIPVFKGMTLEEIKKGLLNELNLDALMGNIPDIESSEYAELCTAIKKAIQEIKPKNEKQKTFFNDLEENDEDSETSPYAYFVFKEKE